MNISIFRTGENFKKNLRNLLLIVFLFFTPFVSFAHNATAATSSVNFSHIVQEITQRGDDLLSHYNPSDGMNVIEGFNQLYFDFYEASGFELAVATASSATNIKTEALFTKIIGAASSKESVSVLTKHWSELKSRLNANLTLIQTHSINHFSQAFIESFSILLREGFEAMIIITALLTFVRRTPHAEKATVIYYGAGSALGASLLTAVLLATIFKNLGSHREAMEGITMLIASAVMFYVSYWLLAKRESAKWQGYIKHKMNHALSTSNTWALALTAFLAVYREGAETILFYQALFIGSPNQLPGLASGFLAACMTLLLIYWGLKVAAFKMPYRLFFTVTAIFLYYMSFTFIGRGILELQQAGWISVTPIEGLPQLEWLGIFPSWQNMSVQVIFLVVTLGVIAVWYLQQYLRKQVAGTIKE